MEEMLVSIDSIFKKTSDGNYDKNALLYQDILRYSIVINTRQEYFCLGNDKSNKDNNCSFTHWTIAKWLLENNQEFIDRYSKNSYSDKSKKERIENSQKRVKRKLNDLVNLGLIQIKSNVKQQKGNSTVPIYQHTEFGYFMAWLIEGFQQVSKQSSNSFISFEKLYYYLQLIFPITEDSTASIIFFSKFFKKCKEKELFVNIIYLVKEILDSGRFIKDIVELFRLTLQLNFKDVRERIIFNELFNETVNELDEDTKKLVLYQLKLDLEKIVEQEGLRHYKGFEDGRFRVRGSYELAAIEGYCYLCQLYYPLGVNILEYRGSILFYSLFGQLIPATCPKCKIRSLVLPNILY